MMLNVKEVYTFLMEKNEEQMLLEEKKIEKLFGELNEEQLLYLSELRYKFFKLGYENSDNSIWVVKNLM